MDTFSQKFSLEGKVALVTGAAYGIGFAIAEAYAQAGAKIAFNCRSQHHMDQALTDYKAKGIDAKGYICDVTKEDEVKKMVTDIEKELGTIDILVNNAGITKDDLVLRMKDDAWEDVIETDLTAAFRLARACVRPMMKQRSGRIISMGSVVGAMGNAGQVNYAAAKAGLMGMTKALAREIGSRGVTVNCVAPGFIDTDMTKDLPEDHREALLKQIALGRLGQTDDIANACLYLASPAGAYLTGVTLHVNGGMFMG